MYLYSILIRCLNHSSVTMMTMTPTNLFHHDLAIDNAFNSITSPVKFVEHPVDDALPTAVPKPTNTASSGSNDATSKDWKCQMVVMIMIVLLLALLVVIIWGWPAECNTRDRLLNLIVN